MLRQIQIQMLEGPSRVHKSERKKEQFYIMEKTAEMFSRFFGTENVNRQLARGDIPLDEYRRKVRKIIRSMG